MFAVIQTNGLFQQESISSWFNQNDHDNINDNRLLQNPKKKKKNTGKHELLIQK